MTMNPTSSDKALSRRLAALRARIAAAGARGGRPLDRVTLVAVTKGVDPALVIAACAAGIADLGENRLQDAAERLSLVQAAGQRPRWHFIGHLQRNKAGKALALFDLVHGVDDAEVAGALQRRAESVGRVLPVLIEVNTSAEASKFGVAPEGLVPLAERVAALTHLALRGLMTVGAPVTHAADARPGFVRLRELRDTLSRRLGTALPELSMGMSGDYEVAIEEGATLVRVGSAIFGERPAPAR